MRAGDGKAAKPSSDEVLWAEDFIVVTPMRVGEVDYPALQRLQAAPELLPAWREDERPGHKP